MSEKGQKLKEEIKTRQEALKQLQALKDSFSKHYDQISELKEKKTEKSQVLLKLTELCDLRKEGAKVKADFSDANKAWKAATQKWQSAKDAYYGNMAVVLAGELKEDEPCPVCGGNRSSRCRPPSRRRRFKRGRRPSGKRKSGS
ncbi:MAG: hypothetical protein U5K84_14420 [Alkalibacterium sp.]|nr:hypothetical protein [Alkalibacterium sp.]